MSTSIVPPTEPQLAFIADLKRGLLEPDLPVRTAIKKLPDQPSPTFLLFVARSVLLLAIPEPASMADATELIDALRTGRDGAREWFKVTDPGRGRAIMAAIADRYGESGERLPEYTGDMESYARMILDSVEA